MNLFWKVMAPWRDELLLLYRFYYVLMNNVLMNTIIKIINGYKISK